MKHLRDEQTWREAIAAEQAMLFFHCEWGYSISVLRTLEKWEREWLASGSAPPVAVYMAADGDDSAYPPSLLQWLKSQSLDALAFAGNGEILWLERGRVVAKLMRPRGVSPAELTQRTAELWGLE